MSPRVARAVACANIALIKYWGKQTSAPPTAAVPSLSMTLEAFRTVTTVAFGGQAGADQVWLNGRVAEGRELARVVSLLDRVRSLAGSDLSAEVRSDNNFPTAAGLASSASGFAALAAAALAAAGIEADPGMVSEQAGRSSLSAARSVHGGFVALDAGASAARPVTVGDTSLVMVVALTAKGPKAVSSSAGMALTEKTSPYYSGWVELGPKLMSQAETALRAERYDELGQAMERSTLAMHATMLGADPPLLYWNPTTVAAMSAVQALRARGLFAYFTMDAGPHVKVLTRREQQSEVQGTLQAIPGVVDAVASHIGGAVRVEFP